MRTDQNETEILLGNKQLLGIFFVAAILLGAAFTGGYMLGRDTGAKKGVAAASAAAATSSTAENSSSTAGETHSFPADSGSSGEPIPSASKPAHSQAAKESPQEAPLGTPKAKKIQTSHAEEPSSPAPLTSGSFSPQTGQEFLQVAAVGRDEAEAVADVLHKKGFRAHAVPKPGTAKLYRVIIGPIRDAGDLSNTRDALRRTGFREVIVQRY